MTKTAAIYARYSTDMQNPRSIGDQFALCEDYAKREDITVIARFGDSEKSSATMFDRDGLLDLRNDAKAKKFDVVIVECLDRISRDPEDLHGLFKRLTHYGVQLITVNEGVTTDIHVGIRSLVGRIFMKDLADKVRRGHNGRAREGKFSGCLTYGYDRVLGQPGERVINEVEATVIRRIFKQYAEGISPRTIAADLTRDGIRTPDGLKEWNHQTFVTGGHQRGVISNPLYKGLIVWNTHHTVRDPDTGKQTKRSNPESDHIITEVPHLRIIDQPTWDAAQAVRKQRAVAKFGAGGRLIRSPVTPRNTNHLLAGLLRCGVCNGHMRIGQNSRGGSSRVVCAAAHQRSTCAHRKSYDMDVLKQLVLDNFRNSLTNPERVKKMAQAYHTEYAEVAKREGTERTTATKQLNRIKVQIDRIVNTIIDVGNSPAMSAKLAEMEASQVQLEERIRLLSATNVVSLHPSAIKMYTASIDVLHQALVGGKETSEIRLAFRNIIDSIVVHQTAKRMPYEVSAYGRMSAIMGVDLFPTKRSNAEILAAEGHLCTDTVNTGNTVLAVSQQRAGVIALGRWKAAA